jgi:hypothetical protein
MAHHKLTRRQCDAYIKARQRLGKTGLANDGGGLYLRATATGTASWVYRYETAAAPMSTVSAATPPILEERGRRRCRQQKFRY